MTHCIPGRKREEHDTLYLYYGKSGGTRPLCSPRNCAHLYCMFHHWVEEEPIKLLSNQSKQALQNRRDPVFLCVLLPSMSLFACNCYSDLFGYSIKDVNVSFMKTPSVAKNISKC